MDEAHCNPALLTVLGKGRGSSGVRFRVKSPDWSRRLSSATFMRCYLTSPNPNIFIPQAKIRIYTSVGRFVYNNKKSTL